MDSGGGSRQAQRGRVLVVDDDPTILQLLHDIFAKTYDVFDAADGEAAIALLDKQPIDAIVSDQMMPRVSGIEVLKHALEKQPRAVRILVTASDSLDNARDAINLARVARFVAKPFRPLELLEIIRGSLRETELQEENRRILDELKEKNALLTKALSTVQDHERKLEEEVRARTAELQHAVSTLEDLALRDGLTGLYNHRFFQEALSAEIARCGRHDRKAALIFLDVDHFKNYNDLLGHPKGDALLMQLARILSNTSDDPEIRIRGRVSDIAARYGGEEFVIILPESDKAGGAIRAERLRAQVAAYPFEGRDRQPGGTLTVSIGVAAFPEDAITKQDLIQAADQALLAAKREGRNRVKVATPRPG
jgi:diguanylate cyclase (GGDEF)-like protein